METVKNIVEEMRYVALRYLEDGNDSASVFEILSSYADRLDAAYKRDMQSMVEAGEMDMDKLREENERIKSALKPVLEFDALFGDLDEFDCVCKFCTIGHTGCRRGKAMRMRNAILKAKEIMKRQGNRDVRMLS